MQVVPEEQIKQIKKILLIQYKPFGDVLLNTGYFEALREKFPDAQIDFLVQKPYATLLVDNPHIDNLVLMQKKKKLGYYIERLRMIRLVRKSKYDVVIDQLRGTGSAQITMFSGASIKIGWHLKRWNNVFNYRRKRTNDRYYSIMKFALLEPLGIKLRDHSTFYHIKEESQQRIDDWLNEINLSPDKLITISPKHQFLQNNGLLIRMQNLQIWFTIKLLIKLSFCGVLVKMNLVNTS